MTAAARDDAPTATASHRSSKRSTRLLAARRSCRHRAADRGALTFTSGPSSQVRAGARPTGEPKDNRQASCERVLTTGSPRVMTRTLRRNNGSLPSDGPHEQLTCTRAWRPEEGDGHECGPTRHSAAPGVEHEAVPGTNMVGPGGLAGDRSSCSSPRTPAGAQTKGEDAAAALGIQVNLLWVDHRRGARHLHAGRLRAGRDRLLPGEARRPRGVDELRHLRARVRRLLLRRLRA